MGVTKERKAVFVLLSDAEDAELDALAEHYRMTRPQLMRWLLRAEVKRAERRAS